MSRFIVVGGTGMMGSVAVRDLFETTKDEIVIAARTGAKEAARKYNSDRVNGVQVDVKNIEQTVAIFKESDVVLNCAIYYTNLDVMRACLKAGCHYLDLGGLFHITNKQLELDKQFKNADLNAVLGMGSTPGITNVLSAYGSREFENIDSINIKVGWQDFSKRIGIAPPVPYAIATIVDEFTKEPAVFQSKKMKFVQPVSGKEQVIFPKPIGKKTAFYTLHSELATFPKTFGAKNVSFRVSFDEDFVKNIQYLVSLGITRKDIIDYNGIKLSPLDFLAHVISIQPTEKVIKREDYECLRVEITGTRQWAVDNEQRSNSNRFRGSWHKAHSTGLGTLQLDCLVKSGLYNHSAGDIDTGTPPSIVAQMISKKIIKDRGVFAPEFHVPEEMFFKELKKRNMQITKRWL